MAAWGCAALRGDRRRVRRQQEAHLVEFGLSYARNALSYVAGGISKTLESYCVSRGRGSLKFYSISPKNLMC